MNITTIKKHQDNQIKTNIKIIKLKPKYTEMKENFLYIGHRRFQNVTSAMLSTLI